MAKSRRLATLGTYLRPHWQETALGIVALLAVNGLGVYIPLLIRNCVNKLSSDFNLEEIFNYVAIIALLSSAMWLIRMASRIWLLGVRPQITKFS
ncbi:MAG: ABC transporter ATP-binding protein, partial [Cyanobacteria bacterium J06639_18]